MWMLFFLTSSARGLRSWVWQMDVILSSVSPMVPWRPPCEQRTIWCLLTTGHWGPHDELARHIFWFPDWIEHNAFLTFFFRTCLEGVEWDCKFLLEAGLCWQCWRCFHAIQLPTCKEGTNFTYVSRYVCIIIKDYCLLHTSSSILHSIRSRMAGAGDRRREELPRRISAPPPPLTQPASFSTPRSFSPSQWL